MRLRNFNLEDEDFLYEPQKGPKVKKMRNIKTNNKSEISSTSMPARKRS